MVDGINLCCQNKNAINQTFNLTFGNAKKINSLVDILKSEFPNITVNYKPRDKLMPERGTLSVDKAKNLINYNPTFSIDKGYTKYISWYKNFWKKINN